MKNRQPRKPSREYEYFADQITIPNNQSATQVLRCLASHVDDAGTCFPSIQHIMQETGYSRRTVEYAIQFLKDGGLIEFRKRGYGKTNHYNFNRDWLIEIALEHEVQRLIDRHQRELRRLNKSFNSATIAQLEKTAFGPAIALLGGSPIVQSEAPLNSATIAHGTISTVSSHQSPSVRVSPGMLTNTTDVLAGASLRSECRTVTSDDPQSEWQRLRLQLTEAAEAENESLRVETLAKMRELLKQMPVEPTPVKRLDPAKLRPSAKVEQPDPKPAPTIQPTKRVARPEGDKRWQCWPETNDAETDYRERHADDEEERDPNRAIESIEGFVKFYGLEVIRNFNNESVWLTGTGTYAYLPHRTIYRWKLKCPKCGKWTAIEVGNAIPNKRRMWGYHCFTDNCLGSWKAFREFLKKKAGRDYDFQTMDEYVPAVEQKVLIGGKTISSKKVTMRGRRVGGN